MTVVHGTGIKGEKKPKQTNKQAVVVQSLATTHLEYCAPVLGSSVQERNRQTGVSLVKEDKDG